MHLIVPKAAKKSVCSSFVLLFMCRKLFFWISSYIHRKWSENIVIRFSKTRMACDVIGNETVQNYNGVTALLPPLENMSCLPFGINVLARMIIMSSSPTFRAAPSEGISILEQKVTWRYNLRYLVNKRHGSWTLEQTIWLWNHTSHTKFYFNEFVANALCDNIGMMIFDLQGYRGC